MRGPTRILSLVAVLAAIGCDPPPATYVGPVDVHMAADTAVGLDAATFPDMTDSGDAGASLDAKAGDVPQAADTPQSADTAGADDLAHPPHDASPDDVAADLAGPDAGGDPASWPVVGTDQTHCYDTHVCTPCPAAGEPLHGQDAQYRAARPTYEIDGDTVLDRNTGLIWQKTPAKLTWDEAQAAPAACRTGGHDDWRLPTIDELYSLIRFSGLDPSGCASAEECSLVPYVDATVFDFEYGDTDAGERIIDAQYASSTEYVGRVMDGQHAIFGVNFADGRIKGYGTAPRPGESEGKRFFVRLVRGAPGYGENRFVDRGDGTVDDTTTGLTWMKTDSGSLGLGGAMDWAAALAWCEGLVLAGQDDWRLPDAKELQGIVDYTRSPSTTGSAAIDAVFETTPVIDEGGATNWGFYWTGTTHAGNARDGGVGAEAAVYVAFGEALGWMQNPSTGEYRLMDVHGAGAQRSDPKEGNAADYPYGRGPQGDVIRIANLVRCVRGGDVVRAEGDACEEPPGPESCDTAPPGTACCGDDGCDPGETTANCPADCAAGPAPCESDADCATAETCPPDADRGCLCRLTPFGWGCVPACLTDADCPSPPSGALVCAGDGVCVPPDDT